MAGGGRVWFQRCKIGVKGLPMKQGTAVTKRNGGVCHPLWLNLHFIGFFFSIFKIAFIVTERILLPLVLRR